MSLKRQTRWSRTSASLLSLLLLFSIGVGQQAQLATPVVPLTAVTRSKTDPNAYAVMVVEDAGGRHVARLRNVTLGESYGNSVAVNSGVKAGEIVVTIGVTQVADGEEVRVTP